ncbi:MAG: hypothetical protein DMG97_40810 [Acidobacteria bacterium]|nr:MAG: hypothetical protein DMG97_40810 [Acidobacteriota bacterium]
MLRGVGDFVVILLFIISSSPYFHSGWPLMVYRSARKKDSEQGSETHSRCATLSFRPPFEAVRFLKRGMVSLP